MYHLTSTIIFVITQKPQLKYKFAQINFPTPNDISPTMGARGVTLLLRHLEQGAHCPLILGRARATLWRNTLR